MACTPAALVTTIGLAPSPVRSTSWPTPELESWTQRRRGAWRGRSPLLARSTSNMTSAWATSAAHSAAWAGVRVTGAV